MIAKYNPVALEQIKKYCAEHMITFVVHQRDDWIQLQFYHEGEGLKELKEFVKSKYKESA